MEEQLIKAAMHARMHAYAPYSGFKVGAAILTYNDIIVEGCNVENASYGATNCAERTAIFKAISEGHRSFQMIAIVGGDEKEKNKLSDYAYPCGICRQVMREFCDPKTFRVIVARSTDDYRVHTLEELLPESFGPEHLR